MKDDLRLGLLDCPVDSASIPNIGLDQAEPPRRARGVASTGRGAHKTENLGLGTCQAVIGKVASGEPAHAGNQDSHGSLLGTPAVGIHHLVQPATRRHVVIVSNRPNRSAIRQSPQSEWRTLVPGGISAMVPPLALGDRHRLPRSQQDRSAPKGSRHRLAFRNGHRRRSCGKSVGGGRAAQ